MKNIKSILAALAIVSLTLFSACSTDQKTTTFDTEANNYVGFGVPRNTFDEDGDLSQQNAKLWVPLDENNTASEIRIPIVRTNTAHEASVTIEVEFATGVDALLTMTTPATLVFAPGIAEVYAKFSYNFEPFPYYEPQLMDITIQEVVGAMIAPDRDSVYIEPGATSTPEDFVLGNFSMLSPDVEVSVQKPVPFVAREEKAIYFSFFMGTYWEVEVDESDPNILPGFYRMKTPYGEGVAYDDGQTYLPGGPYDIVVDARDEDEVVISLQPIGIDFGDGAIFIESSANFNPTNYDYGTKDGDIIDFGDMFYGLEDGRGYGADIPALLFLTEEAFDEWAEENL